MLSAISTRAISDWGVRTEHLIAGRRAYRRNGLILLYILPASTASSRRDLIPTRSGTRVSQGCSFSNVIYVTANGGRTGN